MKIQNLADSLTADPAAFSPRHEYDRWKTHNAPFLIEEYFITENDVDEYTIRVSVRDEDQNPVVTGVVDVYDDMESAKLQLAYVASLIPARAPQFSDAQLRALLDTYELFTSAAQFPEGREDFTDLRMVQYSISYVLHSGKDIEELFAVPVPRRKTTPTDYSQHRMRAVATAIVRKFQAA